MAALAQLTPSPGSPFTGTTNTPYSPGAYLVADFNGDGKMDLLLGGTDEFLGDGAGNFTLATPSQLPAGISGVGDYNGDGKLDLVKQGYSGGPYISIYLGDGAGHYTLAPNSPFILPSTLVSAVASVAGDFNSDGKLDFVSLISDGTLVVMLGDGTGRFTAATNTEPAVSTSQGPIALGDFNNDGIPDLAFIGGPSNSYALEILLGNGTGGFAAAGSPIPLSSEPVASTVADFNGDGKMDLAVTTSTGTSVLLGNGSGGFYAAPGSPIADHTWWLVGDFNGDTIPDLIGLTGHQSLTLLLGDGLGGFTEASGSPLWAGDYATSIGVGDFNGDHKPDVAIASGIGPMTMILLGGVAPTTTTLTTTAPSSLPIGTPVSFTVTVSQPPGSSTAPTGTMLFLDGITATVPTHLGVASQTSSPYTFTATNLTNGTHTIYALYEGDFRSSESTSNSVTITVITYGPAPGPFNISAAAPNTVNLTWADNATNAVAILVERSTDNVNFTQIASLGGNAASYSDSGLTTGASSCTEYFYRIRAQYAAGFSSYAVATQGEWICPVPPAPTGVAVGQSSINPQGEITINWQTSSVLMADRVQFAIYRSLDGVTFIRDITVDGSLTTAEDAGLAANTRYYYYIQAFNSTGTSPPSNIDAAFTAPAPITGGTLLPPSNVAASQNPANPQTQINVTWQNNSTNTVETGVTIFRSTDGVTFIQLVTAPYSTTYTDTGLTPSTAYYYYVKATGPSGTSAASNADWTITAQVVITSGPPPAAPGNLAAGQSSVNPQSQVNLYWQDNSNNEAGFQIFRSLDGGTTFTQLATVGPNVTTYQDAGLTPSTEYYYYVKAYNPAGTSAASNTNGTITATSTTTTGPPPPAPTNVAAGQSSVNPRTQINVYWQDNASNEAGFQIFRSQDGVTFSQIATVLPTSFEIAGTPPATVYYDQDASLLPNTTYYYYVKAFNAAGTSAASNTDSTITAP
jgi:hypothetical protein